MKGEISIGRVIEISNNTVSILVNKEYETSYVVIDSSAKRIGGVGNFIRIENNVYEIINEKLSLDLHKKEFFSSIASNKILICKIIGYFENKKYKQGISGETPNIFDNVYTLSNETIKKIYTGNSEGVTIKIGKYLYKKELDFGLDIDRFFASHSLIVGNTGSGKSNTLNTIFSNLFQKVEAKNSKFLFIDTNGEYSQAFTNSKKVLKLNAKWSKYNSLKIPLDLLEKEDWRLLLEATEKTQYPIIKSVWDKVRKNIFQKSESINKQEYNVGSYLVDSLKTAIQGILNSNSNISSKFSAILNIKEDISFLKDDCYTMIAELFEIFKDYNVNSSRIVKNNSNVYSDCTSEIIERIKSFQINTNNKKNFTIEDFGFLLSIKHVYRIHKYGINEQNTSPLIARFNSNKREFEEVFSPFDLDKKENNIIDALYEDKDILVCDVSSSKKDISRLIVSFICSKIYNFAIKQERNEHSYHLIVDEAHNYLSAQKIDKEDAIAKTCIETFESIIKEGRKFGVFLTMSTQRPSDITSTLLSQVHNYVIHKLVNPRDIEIMKSTVPFIDEMSISMLSILSPGQAIFSGTAFNRPNIVEIDFIKEDFKVESGTIKLTKQWIDKQQNNEINLLK